MFRKLNDRGLELFSAWLDSGTTGPAPTHLLTDETTSEPLTFEIEPEDRAFSDRHEFGAYLTGLLQEAPGPQFERDIGFWTALCLFWFDRILPADENGARKLGKLSEWYRLDLRHTRIYRHLVRTPWWLASTYGEQARYLLLPISRTATPLHFGGDLLEQLCSTQRFTHGDTVVDAGARLFASPETGNPKNGAGGSSAGSPRRLAAVLNQLEMTYDLPSLSPAHLVELLPHEFDRWR